MTNITKELTLLLNWLQVHLLTDNLQQFVLVGESAAQNAAVKQLRIVVAAPPPTPGGELMVSVHVIQDTAASLACELSSFFFSNFFLSFFLSLWIYRLNLLRNLNAAKFKFIFTDVFAKNLLTQVKICCHFNLNLDLDLVDLVFY